MFSHQLHTQKVILEGVILKPNMVVPGSACPTQEAVDDVADVTMNCLLRAVPAAVPAIAFLSGGQSAESASARLNAMHLRFKSRLPWAVAFSYARAIQQPALELWEGVDANVPQLAGFVSTCMLQPGRSPGRILGGDGEEMTGSKHNHEGNSSDKGDPDPGP